MAVDTAEEKLSLLNFGLPFIRVLPFADNSLDQGDKQHLLGLYSGIMAAAGQVTDWTPAAASTTWTPSAASTTWTPKTATITWTLPDVNEAN